MVFWVGLAGVVQGDPDRMSRMGSCMAGPRWDHPICRLKRGGAQISELDDVSLFQFRLRPRSRFGRSDVSRRVTSGSSRRYGALLRGRAALRPVIFDCFRVHAWCSAARVSFDLARRGGRWEGLGHDPTAALGAIGGERSRRGARGKGAQGGVGGVGDLDQDGDRRGPPRPRLGVAMWCVPGRVARVLVRGVRGLGFSCVRFACV